MSEQELREYIKEVITKESAGWSQGTSMDQEGPIANQGATSALNEGGDILQEVVREDIFSGLEEKEQDMTRQSGAGREDRVRIVLKV